MSNPITITQTSEFMKNLLPANPVPAGKRFVAFQDQDENPAVFSLGEDSKLNLIITEDDYPTLVDFGALCNINGTVRAFDVQQSDDNSLYIVVASDAGNNKSNLYILNNISPSKLLSLDNEDILFAGGLYPLVYDIFISNFVQSVGTTNFPMMFLSLAPEGAITQSSQLGYLDVTSNGSGYSFSLNTSWRLMTDPIQIYSVTFGTCPLGKGAFVLYEASDGNHIQFTTFGGNGFVCEPQCPSGATCLTSYVNPATNYTELLVGGDVITQYTYRQYCVGGGQGTTIATGDTSLGLKDIHVSETGGELTIWYTTQANGVHYYRAPLSSLSSGTLIQLLADGLGGQISAMLISAEANDDLIISTLVSVDQTGHLTLLQCPSKTHMWQSVPFYAPSGTNNMEVPSFTLRFKAVSQDPNNLVANCKLHIINEGSVQAFANGVRDTIDQDGRWYQADNNGVVSIVVTTDDMSSPQYHIDQFQADGGEPIQLNNTVYNPNTKLNDALMKNVTDGTSLLTAKTKTGEDLIAPGTVCQEDADDAAGTITELNKMQIKFGQPSNKLQEINHGPMYYNPQNLTPTILAGHLTKDPIKLAKTMAKLSKGGWFDGWDVFNWIYEKAQAAVQWGVSLVGKVVNFFIDLGDKIYNFVLNSVESVGKAISWVFEKITVAVQKLIDWIGFLFEWNDMLATADSISAFINAGFDYGEDQIDAIKPLIPNWIQSIAAAMGLRQAPPNVATGSEYQDPDNNATLTDTKDSVGYNFSSYQASYGGMGANGSVDITPVLEAGLTDSGATLEQLWDDVKNVLSDFAFLFVNMASGVGELFTPGAKADEIFAKMGQQFINSAIQCAEDIANFFVDGLSLLVSTFKTLLNSEIQLPIFTALWKTITNGRPFTVLNAFSLIMAIPGTILYKAVKGVAPPDLSAMTKDTFGSYVNGTLTDDPTELGITRSQILLFGGLVIATAVELELCFELISTVTNKIKGLAAETMDTGMIFVGAGLLIAGWPTAGSNDMAYRWIVWGVDCSNVLALALGRFVGWKLEVPREVTAPPIAVWGALDAIPSYMLKIIINVNADKDDPSLLGRHITEDTLTLIKAWLNAIKECVPAEPANKIATFAGYGCTAIIIIMKIVDFYIAADPTLDIVGTTVFVRDRGTKHVKQRPHAKPVHQIDYKEKKESEKAIMLSKLKEI